jgi:AsmA protein
MRILKIIGWALGGIVALLIVGVALVALFFDPNDYKQEIEQLVQDQTGRSFSLSGDLKLSVFPWLAVQVGPAALGNDPAYGNTPMVSIEGARLGIKLRPLLQGRFEIGAVELESPHIVLVQTAEGNNWSSLGGEAGNDTPAADASSSGKLDASIASISIRNGSVSYDDRAGGTQTTVSNFNFNTGRLQPGQPFDLKSSFTLQRAVLVVDAQLTANIVADMDASQYTLNQPELALLLKGDSYPQAGMPVTLQAASVVADVGHSDYRIEQAKIDTQLTGEGYPKDGLPVSITINSLLANLDTQIATVKALNIAAAGAQITGELQATKIVDAPAVTGSIAMAQLSLRELAPKFGIELPVTSDAATLQRFSMTTGLTASTNAVELKPLSLKLDDTTVSGSAGIADLDTKAIRFDLLVDQINLDRYLPPEDKSEKKNEPSAEPTPIPADSIRDLNMRGKLAVNSLTISKIPLTKLSVNMDAANNKLQLNPVLATVYEGKYRGNIALDANGKLPHLAMEQHLDGINFAPLFAALFDTKRVAGRGSTNMNLNAAGADTNAMKQSLSGTLDFNAKDGALEGFDLWYEIRRARAVLKQQAIPARTGAERTAFTALSGTAQIDNGLVTNKDLLATLEYLKVTGQGTANLASDVVDYKLNATVSKIPAEDKLAEQTQDLSGLTIPVRITGTLTDPKVRPDVEGMVKEQAKQRIEEEKQKLQEKAKDTIKDKLRGFLGG